MHVWKQEKARKIFTITFIVILTVVPLSLCFNQSVWLDEAFSLRWSMLPFPSFIRRITLDVCPLYLLLLRIVLMITNNSLLAAKLFSVLAVFLLLLIGVTFVRKQFGYKAMVFYCLFILFEPMMLKRAVEVRMYTWAFLGVTFSCTQVYCLLGKTYSKKNWVFFTLSSLAAAYMHYFSVLTLAVIYAGMLFFYLFTRNLKQLKAWMICAFCTIIGYLPWVPVILRQAQSETTSWIPKSTSRLGVMRGMFRTDIPQLENFYIIMLVVFLIAGLVLFGKFRTFELYWSVLCMSVVWIILIFGLLCEKFARPILVDRYLLIPLCVSILGMSIVWRYIPKQILILPVLFFIVTGIGIYKNIFCEEYDTLTNATLQFAKENIGKNDIVLTDADSLCSVIPYYFPEASGLPQEDIYEGEYEYLWYFDVYQSVDYEKLDRNHKKYVDYGNYGLDFVDFNIIYITNDDIGN